MIFYEKTKSVESEAGKRKEIMQMKNRTKRFWQ